jgi:2-oxoglutarate dehydrogenase E1 component
MREKTENVSRVLMCSGKIYYELEREREQSKRADIAIIRMEQLYPIAKGTLEAALRPYRDGTPLIWVQEEPENMGAWPFLKSLFGAVMSGRLPFTGIARPASASPATGSHSSHKKEQEKLITAAFA